ncbi:isocitrate lyase/PEP mutase family protein, partial [Streptosporangium amethystogenes]|uniref:isocitrate lyase/PEP mutase family protein n=1 Tax=Streptosporangium amethystogenes TaxID=2002 RepID=UPI0004C7B3CA
MTFERFRALHHADEPLLLPCAWDHASAAALARAGFAAIGTTSLGVAAAAGKPDAGRATRQETLSLARTITGLGIPVTVDIEAGFGKTPGQVADLVARLAGLGVAGINLEDGRGTGLADAPAQAKLIAAVKRRVPRVFLNARTDAFWLGLPDARAVALARARAYAEAGADGVFVPGASTEHDIEALVAGTGVPLNVLVRPGVPVRRLADLGVARISYGSLLFRAALHAAVTTALGVAAGEPLTVGVPSYEQVEALHRYRLDVRQAGGGSPIQEV